MLLASTAPSAAPAPTTVCSSSTNRMISPWACRISSSTPLRRSSNSPRNLLPATMEPMSSASTAPAAQLLRHVARDYPLRQPLGDGRLAHAGAADQHRVVLRPPDQRLHRPRHLGVAADHRVQLTLAGKLRQVDAEPLQRAVAALRPLVGHPMLAANGLQRPVDLLQVRRRNRTAPSRRRRRLSWTIATRRCSEPMNSSPSRFASSFARSSAFAARGVTKICADSWATLGAASNSSSSRDRTSGRDTPHLAQHVGGDAVVALQQRHQHVLDVPLAVPVAPDYLLRPAPAPRGPAR